ncbi:MAG: alpha/beta fold hydrolase [Gemmatimonadaceae bacterium]|nr:alpha/beta fold hydrolase [Gemmatimonadaceae bacterium]
MAAPPPIPPPRASGFTSSTTLPLYWCRYGEPGAPLLLVLHGGPGAHHDYLLPQFLDLATAHELLFYDQRGGGRSRTDDPGPVTWQSHVEDLERVIAELAVGATPAIAGYSWGGLLALLYLTECAAGRRSPAPTRLALVDPAPASRAWRARFEAEFAARNASAAVRAMRAALEASGLRERDHAAYRQRAFEISVAGYFAHPGHAAGLTPFRVTGRVQQQVWESLGDFDLVPMLSRAVTEAIVVHGAQDPIPLDSSAAIARALGARLVVLEDCGHVPYVEQRGALFTILGDFLDPGRRTLHPSVP